MPLERNEAEADSGLIDDIADWLVTQALGETTIEELFQGCCERMQSADLPIWRANLGFRTLHPLFQAITLLWRRGEILEIVPHPHGPMSEEFRRSPHYHLLEQRMGYLRRRLQGSAVTLDYPVLEDLRDAGATDYFAYAIDFGGPHAVIERRSGLIGSWTSDRSGGFSAADIRALKRVQRRLALCCKVLIKDQIARNVLDAYLGDHAGRRVLDGEIVRGSGESIHAVIWFSDLRGSTRLSEQMPLDAFLALLNAFFEAIAGAVLEHGGQVLRFIGDAVLAIFPMEVRGADESDTSPIHRQTCETALEAAEEAIARVAKLNERREERGDEALHFGIGLHVGDVMFGNIGVPSRVEYSVVGRAANHAAKIETLCKDLSLPLVVSEDFAKILGRDWIDLGEQTIPGSKQLQRVYTLPNLGPTARS